MTPTSPAPPEAIRISAATVTFPAEELKVTDALYCPSPRPERSTLTCQTPRPSASVLRGAALSQLAEVSAPETLSDPLPRFDSTISALPWVVPKLSTLVEAPRLGGASTTPPAASNAELTALRALLSPQP